jgi:putative membrane protein
MGITQKILAGSAALVVAMGLSGQTAERLKRMDGAFATAAARGGMAEVEMGRLAVQKASSPAVKEFGRRMVDDHSKINDEFKAMAARKGMSLPSQVSAKGKTTMTRLSHLNGAAFDRAYMDDMVKDHEMDIDEFQLESNDGTDPDLQAFAAKTLPILHEHLQLAQQTRGELK